MILGMRAIQGELSTANDFAMLYQSVLPVFSVDFGANAD